MVGRHDYEIERMALQQFVLLPLGKSMQTARNRTFFRI